MWLEYSRDTIRTAIIDIKDFFTWCVATNRLAVNVSQPIQRVKPRKRRKKPPADEGAVMSVAEHLTRYLTKDGHVYTDDDGTLVVNPAAHWTSRHQHAARDLFILTFLFETGARAGELSNLGRKIMRQVIKEPMESNGTYVYEVEMVGKIEDPDEPYVFTESTVMTWRIWDAVRPRGASVYAICDWHKETTPNKMKTESISKMLIRRCFQAHVQKKHHFRSHALRAAKISRTRRVAGIKIAQLLVGHRNLKTTESYDTQTNQERNRAAVQTGMFLSPRTNQRSKRLTA